MKCVGQIPTRARRPSRALKIGNEIDLSLLELARGAAEHVLNGVQRGGQIGVAVRQPQPLDLVRDFAPVVRWLGDDALRRGRHEDDAKAVSPG